MNAEDKVGQFFKRLGRWAKTHRLQTIAIIGALLIAAGGITAYSLLHQPLPKPDTTPIAVKPKPKPAVKYYSPLDGTEIASAEAATAPVSAIMIENFNPDARPQSGIKQAQVVYEAIAEGGITRFLCLYQQHTPGIIGPVRSLRMYYLDWAAPYNASIVHVGGSYYSLQEVRNGHYRDIDIEYHNGASWRAGDRRAPHNVYTNFDRLGALNGKLGLTKSEFGSFPRVDGKPADSKNATSVAVNISNQGAYNSTYAYDAGSNTYARSQGGGAHTDREEGQISPNVVVALKVNMSTVMEDGYRQNIETSGSGGAYVFQNGTVTEATWTKANRLGELKLNGADGQPLPLVRGQTWIVAVPNGSGSVTWQ